MPESQKSCTNPDGRNAFANCVICAKPFCDACLAFVVNRDPACEVCGNRLVDETRPRLALGFGVAAALLACALFGNVAYWIAFGYYNTLFLLPTAVFVVFALRFAWHLADPITGADKPRVERRTPG